MRPVSFCVFWGIEMNQLIKEKLALLPEQPGCYLMKDKTGTIIYVGKAKILKNRVRSYFTGSHNQKTERLISEIADFEYIVTESNIEALVLEINLIQKNKPKYNIMLKDDSSYPYLKITNEEYPRLELVRQVDKKDGAIYYGPYPDVAAATETKKLLDRLFPLRKCGQNNKKPCFYHHLNQCTCPYYFHQSPEEYQKIVEQVKGFMKGEYKETVEVLKQKMQTAASELKFEQAAEYRDQLSAIDRLMVKQKMTNTDFKDRDIIGYALNYGWICVQVFHMRQGKMIKREATTFPSYGEPTEEVLTYIGQFYQQKEQLVPPEIYIPQTIDVESVQHLTNTKIIQPKRGEKERLVALANKNAMMRLDEDFALKAREQERTKGACEQLGKALGISSLHRIEAFDNSNIMGKDAVSGMVVFIDGKKSPHDYRKFKIKTVEGADDYASMREVIFRRYRRLLNENKPLPDLILMDGGKGQMSAAKEVLHEQLGIEIPVAGMAKNDRHKTSELLYGDPEKVIPLSKKSEAFFLLHRIQDEVHRYAITFHRQLRNKNSFASKLDQIEGVGPKRKRQLLLHFQTMTQMSEASCQDLINIGLPKKVAENVYHALHENNKS